MHAHTRAELTPAATFTTAVCTLGTARGYTQSAQAARADAEQQLFLRMHAPTLLSAAAQNLRKLPGLSDSSSCACMRKHH
jgi:hypothetical protein